MRSTDDPIARDAAEDAEFEYTEEVVEYSGNSRQRVILAALMVLLFLLLLGLSATVVYLTRGRQAPAAEEVPAGMTWVRSIYGWGDTQETSIDAPSDVAFDKDGRIWCLSHGMTIAAFNPDGSVHRIIQPPRGRDEKQVDTMEGITIGDDGTIYVTDSGRQMVIEFTPEGEWLGEWPVQFPIEIDTDGDGQLAVTAAGGVAVLTEDADTVIAKWGKRGAGPDDFDLPHGVVFGPDGTVYVSDTQNQRVKAYAPDGKLLWTTGSRSAGSSMTTETASPFLLPSGITMDANNRLVLVDPFSFKIFVLDSKTGEVLADYGDYGEADGWFGYPTGIDYDPDRDWFVVADTANNRLQIVRIEGSGGDALAGIRRTLARPLWVFCFPVILLIIALVILALRRRRSRRTGDSAAPVSQIDAV